MKVGEAFRIVADHYGCTESEVAEMKAIAGKDREAWSAWFIAEALRVYVPGGVAVPPTILPKGKA